MKNRCRTASLRALAVGLLALLGVPAGATTFVMTSDEALVDDSGAVARVQIVEVLPRAASPIPTTRYRVAATAVLKGTLPSEFIVEVPGGLGAGGWALHVAGAPRFAQGEEVLLFLERLGEGRYRIVHLMLGSFRLTGSRASLSAVRELSAATEMAASPTELLVPAPPRTEGPRDLARFMAWIADRAAGRPRPPDYLAAGIASGLVHETRPFEVMRAVCEDGEELPLRWFAFDDAGGVEWLAPAMGLKDLAAGVFPHLGAALAAWNDDPASEVRLGPARHGDPGPGGLRFPDGVSGIHFDDPGDEIPRAYSCAAGGILAIGGPWFRCEPREWEGLRYRPIVEADIVTQDGAGCVFAGAGGADGARIFAHELGHALGLAHSDEPAALMQATLHGGRGAVLGPDERVALATLYAPLATAGAPTGSALSSDQVRCDGARLSGLLARIRTLPVDATAFPTTILTLGAAGAFRGLALVPVGLGERQLAFSVHPEPATLLRHPSRRPLPSLQLVRSGLESDLLAAPEPGVLSVLIEAEGRDGKGGEVVAIDDVAGAAGRSAGQLIGRALHPFMDACHEALSRRHVHLLGVLSRLVRVEAEGAGSVGVALYRGEEPDSYRIDVYPRSAAGEPLGRLAAEVTVVAAPDGTPHHGVLRVWPACGGESEAVCSDAQVPVWVRLVYPGDGSRVLATGYVVGGPPGLAAGAIESRAVDWGELLAGTTWD